MRVPLGKADLAEGTFRGVSGAGPRPVLLVRLGGRFYALDDQCNHSGCPLSGGQLVGDAIRCPCHAMEFDVRTGALITAPRLCDDQRSYPVVSEGGQLFAEVPDS